MNVLFVCTGNTCRSPMAQALLQHKLPNIQVQSAGVYAINNDSANDHAVSVLKEKDIELVHSAQKVTDNLLTWADIVLTMTEGHKQILTNQFPKYKEKYYCLMEYTRSETLDHEDLILSNDIVDPFGGDIAAYRNTLMELEKYIDILVKKLDVKK